MEGELVGVNNMQHVALSSFDKDACRPFFERLTDLFHDHHHSHGQDSASYEELLYKVRRPYTPEMLDMIDDWMGLEKENGKRKHSERYCYPYTQSSIRTPFLSRV
ncbi:MAG: hypothetical protein Ct9H90mP24_6400 [Methanobacteriota archaeon]|nr:MAG: hypothetical protein Ct9H90mP24_6400 [Euryarchaeota archaeon]